MPIPSQKRYAVDWPLIGIIMMLVCVVSWAMSYLQSLGFPMTESSDTTSLWNMICHSITGKEVAYTAGFLIMITGAFLLNQMNYASVLTREKTWLPFILYIFLNSIYLGFMPLMASSIAALCLILSCYMLFSSYHNEQSVGKAFNWAFILAIGSLLWTHLLLYIPLFWFGMYRIRSFSTRTFFASVFGLAIVYWLTLGWCVWQGDFTPFTHSFGTLTHFQLISVANDYNWTKLIPVIAIGLITVVASFRILSHNYEEKLRTHNSLIFLIWLTGLTLVFSIFYSSFAQMFLQTASIPVSILTAHYFTVKRTPYTYGAFIIILLLCITSLFTHLWKFL